MLYLLRPLGSVRLFLFAIPVVLLGIGYAVTTAEEKKEKAPTPEKKIMAEKLANAQLIMQGLALGDFDLIKKSAVTLMSLSKKAEWTVYKTERYEVFSNEFRRSLETIQDKCKDKNLDGTTLAFMEMTLTCVKCHKYCRDERQTSLPIDVPFTNHGH